jgi:hypothetical protein
MSADEIRVGDKGTQFNVTLYDGTSVVDLSASTARTFEFRMATGTVFTVTASLVGSGTSGGLTYTVDTTTVLAVEGKWKLQARVLFAASQFRSDISEFRVFSNLS